MGEDADKSLDGATGAGIRMSAFTDVVPVSLADF